VTTRGDLSGHCIAVGLIGLGLGLIVRLVRFVLALVLVAMVVDALSGHGPTAAAHLLHLL
jgi:hypothetical protein